MLDGGETESGAAQNSRPGRIDAIERSKIRSRPSAGIPIPASATQISKHFELDGSLIRRQLFSSVAVASGRQGEEEPGVG